MLRFLLRRLFLLALTMALVSVAVFLVAEASPGNVARNVLGAFVTPEQEASFLAQHGLDQPVWTRYRRWLLGTRGEAERKIGLPLARLQTETGFEEWWARDERGRLLRWKVEGDDLIALVRQPDGTTVEEPDNGRWRRGPDGTEAFWGVDTQNRAARWVRGKAGTGWTFLMTKGWQQVAGAPEAYIPLRRGFLRGDPGVSLRTGRPVGQSLGVRVRNSLVLAGVAFVLVMPLALALGMVAGVREGSLLDRVLSIGGMLFSVIPEFATGIFLILIFSAWLGWFPGAAAFGQKAPWERPDMLVLPVLTLTLIELGYVLRITRASMADAMRAPYVRTAFLKGLPWRRVVLGHAARNALIAPITVIMLHVNWLLGGIVVVEVVFGYPGLGQFLLESALYKDVPALEAGAMIMVLVAVGTQLVADVAYALLNPRIRYA